MMTDKRVYRVVVVEDEPIILNNIVSKIEKAEAVFHVTGIAYNGAEALEIIEKTVPHLLITDIQMPQLNGLELIKEVSIRYPQMLIVILSNYNDFEYAKEALKYGVKEYLLKTPSIADVTDVLQKMSRILEERDSQQIQQYIYNTVHHRTLKLNDGVAEDLEWVLNMKLNVYFIHFGNMSNAHIFPDLKQCYEELLEKANLNRIILGSQPKDRTWWLIDQPSYFGTYFIVKNIDRSSDEPKPALIGLDLMKTICEKVHPFPISIFIDESPCSVKSLEQTAYSLVQACEKNRVYGKSLVYTVNVDQKNPLATQTDAKSVQKMEALFSSTSRTDLRQRVHALIQQWEYGNYSQKSLEKHILYFIQMLHSQKTILSDEELDHMEYELFYILYKGYDLTTLQKELFIIVEDILFDNEDHDLKDIENIVKQIEKLLKENYSSQISLDEIAAKFYFTSSYLSKTFKKYMQVSPLRYVIMLRIEEAKRLIRENPELTFKEVGALVGYADQNYFSRIFKNSTGQSLSDYRQV